LLLILVGSTSAGDNLERLVLKWPVTCRTFVAHSG